MERGWFEGVMPSVKQEPEAFTPMIIYSTSTLWQKNLAFLLSEKVSGQLVKLAALNSPY